MIAGNLYKVLPTMSTWVQPSTTSASPPLLQIQYPGSGWQPVTMDEPPKTLKESVQRKVLGFLNSLTAAEYDEFKSHRDQYIDITGASK